MQTVLEALRKWSSLTPDKKAWTFLNDQIKDIDSYTYRELENATNHLALHLRNQKKIATSERILLVFYPGLDFTVSLIACMKAGFIAVPVFPPDPYKLKKDLDHFINIQINCQATIVLTNSLYNFVKKTENLKKMFGMSSSTVKWPILTWIEVDDILRKGKLDLKGSSTDSNSLLVQSSQQNDIAFLQYTSGSTSDPKGVMITQQNLSHNLKIIVHEINAVQDTVCVSWLPQYHDMGLIGSYLGLLYCGGCGYYLSPISFLKDPIVWIQALSIFKGTHTQAPNFAYALVSRKFNEANTYLGPEKFLAKYRSLDLNSVQHMINAAEPVDFESIQTFYQTFSSYGLNHGVVVPTYGLAEHTVFVCSGGTQVLLIAKESLESGHIQIVDASLNMKQASDSKEFEKKSGLIDDSTQLVGCGYPGNAEGVEVVIVDVNSLTAKDMNGFSVNTAFQIKTDGVVGEVWVNSLSKAMGYWNLPELTKSDFHSRLRQRYDQMIEDDANLSVSETEYLRTGDLGFMYQNELFICGRSKDLIIVRGSNHYPQDIEKTAEESCAGFLRPGCSAAFALSPKSNQREKSQHTESVVYVAELKEDVKATEYNIIVEKIRDVVAKRHGINFQCICLLKTRTVPKTTSGKIARSWCRRGFMDGTLSILHRWEGENMEETNQIVEDIEENVNTSSQYQVNKTGESQEDSKPLTNETIPKPGAIYLSEEEVKSLSIDELIHLLESMLIQLSQQSNAPPLLPPISKHTPVSNLGLDSMTLVQFHGVLQNRFYCEVPEKFLITNQANLFELAKAVRIGHLTDEQTKKLDALDSIENQKGNEKKIQVNGSPDDGLDEEDEEVIVQKELLCPWFTCCYC